MANNQPTEAIDLSAGLEPITPAPTSSAPATSPIDISAGLEPVSPPSTTVQIGSTPVNLVTGEGAEAAAQGQAQQVPREQLRQAHGAVSFMGRPAASQAAEESFNDQLGGASDAVRPALSGPDVTVPQGKEDQAETAQNLQRVAGAAAGVAPEIGVAEQGAKAVEALAGKIPNVKRAGQTMEALKNEIGSHPVEITDDLSKSVMRIQELADNGNTMPNVARKFIQRVTNPEKGSLTYDEARDFYTKAGSLTADEAAKLSPPVRQALAQFSSNLRQAVADTANRAGKLDQFQKSMSEYRNAKILQDVMDWAKDFSVKGIAQKAGATGALYELKKLLE